ncbi:MAG: glycosyltransferase family 4 protein [Bacteroidota bacterium]
MKILFVLEHYHPYIGGAEKLFQLLAEALAEKGHQVQVLTTRFDTSLAKVEQIAGVEVHRIDCYNRFLFTFLSLPSVIRLARQCDIVHTTTYNAAVPAWLGARIARRPVMVNFHEVWGDLWKRLPFIGWFQKQVYYYYEQMVLRLPFDHFIAVSQATRQSLIQHGIPAAKIIQIYNGLHYEQFAPYRHQPPATFQYIYYGRLGISKGLNLLLPAAKRFSQQHPNSQLTLVLPTEPKAMLANIKQLIQYLGLEEHTVLHHNLTREELFQKVSQSSCVVIPSYSEGFCFVAAEAVAMGVPVISSGKTALKEVVGGKYLELAQLDEVHLADALLKAYRGQWNYRTAPRFEMAAVLKAYLDLYENLD